MRWNVTKDMTERKKMIVWKEVPVVGSEEDSAVDGEEEQSGRYGIRLQVLMYVCTGMLPLIPVLGGLQTVLGNPWLHAHCTYRYGRAGFRGEWDATRLHSSWPFCRSESVERIPAFLHEAGCVNEATRHSRH